MIDWKTIETEYVTTDISHRELCEKYGICRSTISKKASEEKWSSGWTQNISPNTSQNLLHESVPSSLGPVHVSQETLPTGNFAQGSPPTFPCPVIGNQAQHKYFSILLMSWASQVAQW